MFGFKNRNFRRNLNNLGQVYAFFQNHLYSGHKGKERDKLAKLEARDSAAELKKLIAQFKDSKEGQGAFDPKAMQQFLKKGLEKSVNKRGDGGGGGEQRCKNSKVGTPTKSDDIMKDLMPPPGYQTPTTNIANAQNYISTTSKVLDTHFGLYRTLEELEICPWK